MERKIPFVAFIVLLTIFTMLLSDNNAGRVEALTAAECRLERRVLVNACKAIVTGKRPSSYCCKRIRVSHTQCVCPVITKKFAALIDVNYVLKVVKGCGRTLPRHFKCGSITIP